MERAFDFIANTADAVFIVDGRQRVILWNDAATALLGYAAEEALGRACHELLGGRDEHGKPLCRPGCAAQFAVVRAETVPTRDIEVRTKDGGRIWVGVTTVAFPAPLHGRSLLAHLMRDAGKRKALEQGYEQLVRLLGASLPTEDEAAARPRDQATGSRALTRREAEVLRLLASGKSTHAIAGKLGIARTTVRSHVQRVLEKLGVHSRLEAVAHVAGGTGEDMTPLPGH